MAKKKAFQFQFKNPVQDSGEALTNVLFINDTPVEGEVLRLEAEAVPDVTITLKPVADKVVSASNYHFTLTFRPEALALPAGILLDASHLALWGFVCIPERAAAASEEGEGERAPGDVDFYFLYKGNAALEVSLDDPLRLTLQKVGAASKGGTRPTLVQLTLKKKETDIDADFVMLAGGPGGPYNLTENAGLDLLAPRGLPVPTLMAGFVSSDIILNDGTTENGLVLRIVNTGLLPISLSPEGSPSPSRFTLRFEANNTTALLWALGTASQVSSILIPAKKAAASWVIDPAWSGKDDWTVAHPAGEPTWTLTPKARQVSLSPGEAIEVPIGKIITGHATGRTALRIGYSGLPGHSDGELVAFIQKYPLVFADQKVGVGTGSPSEKLTVQTVNGLGITHTNGTVKLSTGVDSTGAALGTEGDHDLRFFTKRTVKMWLKANGKVGIGTDSPSGTLTVHADGHGITHTNESVTLSSWVGTAGASFGTTTDHPLRFYTKSSQSQVTLTTAGNLGIGTESPSEKLHVAGHLRVNGDLKKGDGPFVFWANTDKVKDADLVRLMDGNNKEVFSIKSDGKVGIGTASPSEMLTVNTNGYGITQTNGTVMLSTYVNGEGGWLGTKSEHKLHFYTHRGSPKMTLTTDGKVGIGTSTPAAKLDVNGDFMIKGKKPIEYKFYDITTGADNTQIHTGYAEADWVLVIAGFWANFDEDELTQIQVWPFCYAGTWRIRCDIGSTIERRWRVSAIFIRRELVNVLGSIPG